MQTLWSRVAQAQSPCRCRVCFNSPNTLIRRPIVSASRRKVTAADLFTACYTTILGTATLIDGHRKSERRRELDRDLERARASLHQLVIQNTQGYMDGEEKAQAKLSTVAGRLPSYINAWLGYRAVRPLLEELRTLCNATYRPLAQQSWLQYQMEWADIEIAVTLESQNMDIVIREPQTHHDLADITATILRLVDELLRLSSNFEEMRWQDQTQTPNSIEQEILHEVDILRFGRDFPSYQFPSDNERYAGRVRLSLHSSIRRIFNQAGTTTEIVARICYNLLTAGVPPTIHTYNILIAGFNRIQRADLAQAVIESYLDGTRWPATDQTIVCMLSHYRGPGRRKQFSGIVQMMRGVGDDGLHLATLYEDEMNDTILSWRERRALERVGRGARSSRNNTTFDRLIRGWLYHEELGLACMTLVASLRNGATIPLRTLQELIRGCLFHIDVPTARKLVVGIVKYFENFKWCLSTMYQENTTATVKELLQGLEQIINICWLPIGEIYGVTHQVYAPAVSSLQAVVSRLCVTMEMQETSRLFTLLTDALSSDEPLLTRLTHAVSVFDTAEAERRAPTTYEKAYGSVARLITLERRWMDLERGAQVIVGALNAVLICVKTGYDLDPGNELITEHRVSRAARDQRFAKRRALNEIDIFDTDKPLTLEDIRFRLFRMVPDPALLDKLKENDNWKKLSIETLVLFFGSHATARPPRAEIFGHTYDLLAKQHEAVEDSIRALLFCELHKTRQKRAMYFYRSYYDIDLDSIIGYFYGDLTYNLTEAFQGAHWDDRSIDGAKFWAEFEREKANWPELAQPYDPQEVFLKSQKKGDRQSSRQPLNMVDVFAKSRVRDDNLDSLDSQMTASS